MPQHWLGAFKCFILTTNERAGWWCYTQTDRRTQPFIVKDDSWWPFSLHASLKVRHWFFYSSAMIIEIRKNRSQICHFTLYFETLTQRLVACSSLWLWCYLCLTNSDTDVTLCIAGPGISVSGEWWTRTEAAQRGSLQGSVNRTGHSL